MPALFGAGSQIEQLERLLVSAKEEVKRLGLNAPIAAQHVFLTTYRLLPAECQTSSGNDLSLKVIKSDNTKYSAMLKKYRDFYTETTK